MGMTPRKKFAVVNFENRKLPIQQLLVQSQKMETPEQFESVQSKQ